MFDPGALALFLAAALVLAITPGPGIFYVAARTLAGGRAEGISSSLGTGVGGFVHVAAGAVGVSALVMASAEAFALLKFVGAIYLVYIGVRTWREAGSVGAPASVSVVGVRRAFLEGIAVEALNPKTAAFFLAFIPQFVDPRLGDVAVQFAILGLISVVLNTLADIIVAHMAHTLRTGMAARPVAVQRLRRGSGLLMCGLGVSLAFARRPG